MAQTFFESHPLNTPLNLILLGAVVLLLALRVRAYFSSLPTGNQLPSVPSPVLFRTFTPQTLLPFNGENGKPIYFGVRGQVFDVTPGAGFYGPGGPYENFAGRDASRGLACGSFDEEMLTKDLAGSLDDLADLGEEEIDALRGWEGRFLEKYLVIGRLLSTKDYAELKRKGELDAEEQELKA